MPPKTSSGGVKVAVRVRPFNGREKDMSKEKGEEMRCIVEMQGNNCIVLDQKNDYEPDPKYQAFVFDECFWSMPEDDLNPLPPQGFADQPEVYHKCGAEALTNAWDGYNTCIFAYGQTGSGKSWSMLGSKDYPGISPLIITNLFKHIETQATENPKMVFKVETAFFEIYMEKVKDLFAQDKNSEYSSVKIRQHPLYGIQVQGLETKHVKTERECAKEMEHGVSQRSLASTKMNATSSRSHAIFQIHVGTNDAVTKTKRTATINLVDLAGSERIGKTGATGQTKEEGMAINLSLSTLRKVMDALVDLSKGKKCNPPYRESMLTWVLKESLGGNSKTIMITAISPHYDNIEDTISTLRYGLKAKAIVNKAIKQETSGTKQAAEMKAAIADLELQLKLAQEQGGSAPPEAIAELEKEIIMQKEAEKAVQEELNEVETRAATLEVDLKNAKKRAFAGAFRNAFGMGVKKQEAKVLATRVEEMQVLEQEAQVKLAGETERKEQLEKQIEQSKADFSRSQEEAAQQKQRHEEESAQLRSDHKGEAEQVQDKHRREKEELIEQNQEKEQREEHKHSDAISRTRDLADSERRAEVEEVRSRLQADLDSQRDRLTAEIEAHRAQSSERQVKVCSLEARVAELEPLQDQLATATAELSRVKADYDAQRSTLADQQRTNTALQQSYEQLAVQSERDAANWRQKSEELRAEYQTMRRERDNFRKQVLTLQVLHSADARIISAMSTGGASQPRAGSASPDRAASHLTSGSPRPTSPLQQRPGVSPSNGDGARYGQSPSRSVPRSGYRASPLGTGRGVSEAVDAYATGSPRRTGPSPASPRPITAEPELRGVARLAAALPPSHRDRGATAAHRLSGARSWSPSPHRERGQ